MVPGFGAPRIVLGDETPATLPSKAISPQELLSEEQWQRANRSIDRGLGWLAKHQHLDGAVEAHSYAQPAVTALGVMAFLAAGHQPEQGPYGQPISKAIDFVISCQQDDGLLCKRAVGPVMQPGTPSHTASYYHPLAGLMLAETFGMAAGQQSKKIRDAIDKAITCSLKLQTQPHKRRAEDEGGWRYVRRWAGGDSDLSVTSWELMFLRSARNAGFDVPTKPVDRAMSYVRRCSRSDGVFIYGLHPDDRHVTPAMVAAGVLSLSLGGQHGEPIAVKCGDWILARNVEHNPEESRYFYNAFYCTLAMHQLGGKYWSEFFPKLQGALIRLQRPDGAWPLEPGEGHWGRGLTTSLSVLILAAPHELLPIFQR